MKKLLCSSVAGLLIAGALPASAASTTDLAVKGFIVPSACTLSLSSGTIDVGRISVKDLNQDTRTNLPPSTLQVFTQCEGPSLFAMTATDNRSDSANNVVEFGLGTTTAGERIGGYAMFLDQAIADETPVQMIQSMTNGSTWGRMWDDVGWQTNFLVSIKQIGAASVPIPAKDMQVEMTVRPFINPAQNLTISTDETIDGLATITLRYL
ncbi:DUF1120 domain-containing protein [Pseudomonas veronii]|uniref:DUF1120 domain-containing protein n=1 Tax=Pseudomonas veronii TaxID=76761 RepID=A0A5M8FZW5_PSEVE|nr:DUF1120 domain-containing protein [Pseudomonas veronii]KAA6173818.1 DUF1120 domain-containing protein [Pseudomonas veronii]KAA6189438.1 DUF1120 domain-containing protein [Pseudomonas veronii]